MQRHVPSARPRQRASSPSLAARVPSSAGALLSSADLLGLQHTLGNAVVSRLVAGSMAPIERKFEWQRQTIESKEMLEKSGIERAKIGSAQTPKKGPERDQELNARWDILVQMALSGDNEGVARDKNVTVAYQQLKGLIGKFRQKLRVAASTATSSTPASTSSTSSASSSTSSAPMTTRTSSTAARAREVGDALIARGNVFSASKINELVKLAGGPTGYGWLHELMLARDLAVANPGALIQIGAQSRYEIEPELERFFGTGYQAQASTTRLEGRIGADVAVWRQTSTNKKTTFIQAKTAVKGTLESNVLEAANQLASLTTSGKPEGKAGEREFTFTGAGYEGAIAVQYTPRISLKVLRRAAAAVFDNQKVSAYVHRVVYEEFSSTEEPFLEITRTNREGTFSATNPLYDAVAAD